MVEPARDPDVVRCPNCAEWIRRDAILCRFCSVGLSPAFFYPCPKCAEMVRNEATQCKHCRSPLPGMPFDASPERSFPESSRFLNRDKSPSDRTPSFTANFALIRQRCKHIVDSLKEELTNARSMTEAEQTEVRKTLRYIVSDDAAPLTMMERGILLQSVLDEVFGFGVLGRVLRDPSVREIYVNGPKSIFVMGRDFFQQEKEIEFEDEDSLRKLVDKIFQPFGLELSTESPVVTCTLSNGTWVLAALQPGTDAIVLILRETS